MTFAYPLWLAALPPILGLIYWLYRRRRPQERKVAGLWLWRQARRRGVARRRFDLRLLLLLLAGLLGGLALSGPRLELDRPGPLVLVLDASASMAATDLSPSRLEWAKAQVRERLSRSPRAVLVRAGRNPQAFGPAAGRELLDELEQIRAADDRADLAAAVALGRSRLDAPALVVSDAPPPKGAEGYLNAAGNGVNVGITAVGPGFVAVGNSGPGPWKGEVRVGGRGYALEVPAGGFSTLEVPTVAPLQARLSGADALSLDNAAEFGRRNVRVALEGSSPVLERLLGLLGTVRSPNPELRFRLGTPPPAPPAFSVYFARTAEGEAVVDDVERTVPYLRGAELVGFRLPVPPSPPDTWQPLARSETGQALAWFHPDGLYLPSPAALQNLPAFPVLLYNLVVPRGEQRRGLLSAEETLLPRPQPSRPLPPALTLELTPWLALLAALVLGLEWWLFQYRSRDRQGSLVPEA
ncbi:vWA domain-containing protein [Calidithermus chliarophilus]|uniref:vWA domain-containing protein n=1 Tax=Calidithermus chliarophilus TaxID=52023 RepID=UPI000484EA19|nr:BatA and WFA domain-containing protein [Calidithermus chliarophilus]